MKYYLPYAIIKFVRQCPINLKGCAICKKILPQTPSGEVCLQIIDYCNWAVQRAFLQNDMRYYRFLKEKFGLIVDLYDYKKGWKNFYSKKNPFDIKKISPLRLGIKKYSQHEADFRT